ncbi:MAG: lipopolysaccharide export system permease protein [Humisphaera sp.]|nr:lipopolysaccharide export system permease protein [Humisphaera sp.]
MKILDRYVLFSFLKNYLISFMVLIGLYVVLDMVFNFDELAEYREHLDSAGGVAGVMSLMRAIGDYYFFQTFRIYSHLSGIIPIVAAAFTLIRLTRFNELTAQLAAGIPLTRIAAPIVFASLVLQALLVVDQELLIPEIIPKLTRKHDQLHTSGGRAFAIRAMQDDANGLLNAGRFHPESDKGPPWMEHVDVVEVDENFAPVAHIRADRGEWDARQKEWRLTNGRRVTGLAPNSKPAGIKTQPWPAYHSSITPDEIALYQSGEYVELLPLTRITMLLERPKSYGTVDLQRVKHSRPAQWVINFILVLLAIACVLSREPGKIKQGIAACVMLCGACMGTIFLSYQLAGTPPTGAEWADRWPAIMTWMPIFIFGPIAVWLLDRVYRLKS